MSKKVVAILAVLAVLLVGGFFAVKAYLDNQAHQAYLASANNVADDLAAMLPARNADGIYALLSDSLKQDYSLAYWRDVLLPVFNGHNNVVPKRVTSEQVKPASSTEPPTYDPGQNQNPWRYQYDFAMGNSATYRVTIVVFRQNNVLKVNEFSGAYLP
jgi:hypothetical protein